MTIAKQAEKFATDKHSEQYRKYTGEPYINHPAAVARIVSSVPHTQGMIAAAWLHDTVEDTETTIKEISYAFGIVIASYVESLTDISKQKDGNRAVRKSIDKNHIAQAHRNAKTIKLADSIDNMKNITVCDPGFAKVYLKEKRALLEVLKEGDRTLWDIAYNLTGEKL